MISRRTALTAFCCTIGGLISGCGAGGKRNDPPPQLSGRIRDSRTSAPLSGVIIRFVEQGIEATTDSDGTYHANLIQPGVATLKLTYGSRVEHRTIVVPVGTGNRQSFAMFAEYGDMNALVIDVVTGEPVAGATLTSLSTQAQTDNSGKATISSARAGIILISISKDGYEPSKELRVFDGETAPVFYLIPKMAPVANDRIEYLLSSFVHTSARLKASLARLNQPDASLSDNIQSRQRIEQSELFAAFAQSQALEMILHSLSDFTVDQRGRGIFSFLQLGANVRRMGKGGKDSNAIKERVLSGETVPEVEAWLKNNPIGGYSSLREVSQDLEENEYALSRVREKIANAYIVGSKDSPFHTDTVKGGTDIVTSTYEEIPSNAVGELLDSIWDGVGTLGGEIKDAWQFISEGGYRYLFGIDENSGKVFVSESKPTVRFKVPAGTFTILVSNGTALKPYFATGVTFLANVINRLPDTYAPNGYLAQVPADAGWFDTGVDLAGGDDMVIEGLGEWSHGLEGDLGFAPFYGADGWNNKKDDSILPDQAVGALLGRIGIDGIPFLIGRRTAFKVPASGRLYLSMNDIPDGYLNNEGILAVSVRQQGRSASRTFKFIAVRSNGGIAWRLGN